jgi:hypothetical protein
MNESHRETIEGYFGLMLGLGQVKKRICSEGKIKYCVKISSPKEDAKDEEVESGTNNST